MCIRDSVFLVAGTGEENATALMNGVPRTVEIRKTAAGSSNGAAPVAAAASAAPGPGATTPPT